MLAHNVYFTLVDNSQPAIRQLVDACHQYLQDHPGVTFFAVGTCAQELARPVNDRLFDVALHVVFTDKAAHDRYQEALAHKQFIDENKANWKQVRVFDSYVSSEVDLRDLSER